MQSWRRRPRPGALGVGVLVACAVLGAGAPHAGAAASVPPDVRALADQASMTKAARETFFAARPQLVDSRGLSSCRGGDSAETLVLGCFTTPRRVRDRAASASTKGHIYVLRVDRPELSTVMPVTAAHEMLHVAYAKLSSDERRRINRWVDQALAATTDQALHDQVDEYRRTEPGQLHNELHSLLGTEVAELPGPLERYYRRYFRHRADVVAAFRRYEGVFTGLQQEIHRLEDQINDLRGQLDAANGEANALAGQIDSLRAQGRVAESNQLVGPQNAAVARARGLATSASGLVELHNTKVEELNALYASLGVDTSHPPIA